MKNIIKVKAGTENLTELMYEIMGSIKADCETIIEFEKGTYNFYRKGSEKHPIFSSGGASTENYVIFPIYGKRNLTIEGNGSEFVFCDRIQPIVVRNCENITFRNFSMDYSFLRYAYAEVVHIDDKSFDIAMDEERFEYFVDEEKCLCFNCGEDTISSKHRRISAKKIFPKVNGVYHCSIGNTTAERSGAAPNLVVDAEKIKGGVRFVYKEDSIIPNYEIGDIICVAYDNSREAQSFWCECSKNIVLENVTIYRGGGMGFVADVCENILLDGYRIECKEGRNEYYTTTADGVFLTNCRGDFVMRNSYIADTYDDAMNVHGFYTVVEKIIDNRTVKLTHPYPSHLGLIPCFKGDELHFSPTDTYDEVGSAVVENITYDEKRDNIIVTFDRDVQFSEGMLLENPGRMPKLLLENNVIERCPHIRISSKTMVVKNNKFFLDDFDLYIHDLIAFWGESGATDNVLIEGNTFGNANCNIMVASSRPETSNHLHKNIVVRNNVFLKNREEAIVSEKVENFVLENNTFGE